MSWLVTVFIRDMRKPRYLVPGGLYHVIARANRQERILHSPVLKDLFLKILRKAKKRYQFSLHSFCLMDNHVHLIIEPGPQASLSRILQWILSVFALRYNELHGYKGHVWYDRFKSRVISGLAYFLAAFRYVAQNPLKAGMVTDPKLYPYSSVGRWRHLARDDLILNPPNTLVDLLFPEYRRTLFLPAPPGHQEVP